MEFFAKVLEVLDTPMEVPTAYGWFHLLWWGISIAATIGLCFWHKKSGNHRTVTNVVLAVALTVMALEVYKIINFGFSYLSILPEFVETSFSLFSNS